MKKPIDINLPNFSVPPTKGEYRLNLENLSDNDKKLLAAILHQVAGDKDIPKLSTKKAPLDIIVNGQPMKIRLSHRLRQSTRDGKPVFNVVISKNEKPVLGNGVFGAVKKFVNLINLTGNSGIAFVTEDRADKKQIAKNKRPGYEKDFRERIEKESKAMKVLFGQYDVDEHWFGRNKNGLLVAHQSIPFLGESTQKNFPTLPPLKKFFAVKSLMEQLRDFQANGYAHRDIKPDNVLYDPKTGKLVAVDPGLALKEGESSFHAGTPAYMPSKAGNQLLLGKFTEAVDKRKASQLDVYALGLTIAELFGMPKNHIDDIYDEKGNRRNYFNKIKIADPEIKKELVSLLTDMTRPDYMKAPSMEECVTRFSKIEAKLKEKTPLPVHLQKIKEAIQKEIHDLNTRANFFTMGMSRKANKLEIALQQAEARFRENPNGSFSAEAFLKLNEPNSLEKVLKAPRHWSGEMPLWGNTSSWNNVKKVVDQINNNSQAKLQQNPHHFL